MAVEKSESLREVLVRAKASIKERAEHSCQIRKEIRSSKGERRNHQWFRKRAYGEGTRYFLLAYGCLRGRPYVSMEVKCRDGNDPSPFYILEDIVGFLGRESPEAGLWTEERVETWLKRPEPAETPSEVKEVAA